MNVKSTTFSLINCCKYVCRGSSFGIATLCGLDGPRIEPRRRRDFPHPSRPALGPIQRPIQLVPGLFPGVKRPGRGVNHLSHLAARLKKEWIYDSIPSLGLYVLLHGEVCSTATKSVKDLKVF